MRYVLLLMLFALPLRADVDADYAVVLEAFKAKEWARTVDLAEAFAKANPEFKHTHAALYMGGNAALNAGQHDRGESLCRELIAKHPASKHADKSRSDLASILANARKLRACVVQCDANLKASPEYTGRDYWVVLKGECQFRLWEFKSAEATLKEFRKTFPQSRFAARADGCLALINPPLKAGSDGVVQGYAGKYADDVRFAKALKDLPGHIEAAWKVLRETLGMDLAGKARVLIEFKDKGFVRDTERALAETISIDYQPVTLITMFTEFVVVNPQDFKSRVCHELKHAAFRGLMGQAYIELPKWVREGLAVYGARQLEDRIAALLSNEFFAGGNPRRLIDGIEDADHDVTDYIEDAMAFAWLEARKKGAVHAFCKRLCAGESYQKLFAELAGMEYAAAIKTAEESIRADIEKRLGTPETELKSIQSEQAAAQGRGQEEKWARDSGVEKYAAWLKANPAHVLAAVARYRMARAMLAAKQYDKARAEFELVVADDMRCTQADDARYWIGRGYELEGKTAESEAAYGVLLRDYSWCGYAAQVQAAHKPAGPVKE